MSYTALYRKFRPQEFKDVTEIASFGEIHSEMEKIVLCDALPENWTYPEIQPALLKEAERRGFGV